MTAYEIAFGVVLIIVSVLIVVFTLSQTQKGQGLSAAIMGDSSFMAAGRERGGASGDGFVGGGRVRGVPADRHRGGAGGGGGGEGLADLEQPRGSGHDEDVAIAQEAKQMRFVADQGHLGRRFRKERGGIAEDVRLSLIHI